MDIEKNECGQQQKEGNGSNSATVRSILERGAEFCGQAEQAVSDVYDKTARTVSDVYDKTNRTVSETYEKARRYSSKNPGKIVLISLGIGIGLGFLLSLSSRSSRTGPDWPTCG